MNNIDERIKQILSEEQIPPIRFDYKVKNTLSNLKTKKISNLKMLKLCISTLCCSLVILTSMVFAKDIERCIKKIFNKSTKAIDSAIEEGYIQEIKDDFSYNNGLGIKFDNLLIDNVNLIFSLLYKVEENNIENISIRYFSIYTENGERIYQCDETNQAYIGIAKSMEAGNIEKISEKDFKSTIMLNLWENRNEFNEINIKITSLNIVYSDGTQKELTGNWNFDIEISDKFKENNEIKYIFNDENSYIKSGSATLYPTKMIVKLKLFEDYDIDQIVNIALEDLSNFGKIFSLKNNGNIFPHTNFDYVAYDKELIIIFENIGSYMNIEDELELYLKIYDTNILLKRMEL